MSGTARCPACQFSFRAAGTPPGARQTCPNCGEKFRAAGASPFADATSQESDAVPPRARVVTARPVVDDEADAPAQRGPAPAWLIPALAVVTTLSLGLAAGIGYLFLSERKPAGEVVQAVAAPAPPPTSRVDAAPPAVEPPSPPKVAPLPQSTAPEPVTQPAAPPPAAPPVERRTMSGAEIYKRLLKSTVFIVEENGLGSGELVHAGRRLVLTNYHVVGEAHEVLVFFPDYEGGSTVTEPQHYVRASKKLGIRGTIKRRSPAKDLAIVELDHLPDGVLAVALSSRPAEPGEDVYSIGASGVDLRGKIGGTLWRLSSGQVRQRSQFRHDFRDGQVVDVHCLETQKPINSGDSGGPTVNTSGNLVGVVSFTDPSRDAVKLDIDLIEVRAFLDTYAQSKGFTWDGPVADSDPAADRAAELAAVAARLRNPDADQRAEAARLIAGYGSDARKHVPALIAALDDPEPRVGRAAAAALDRVGSLAAGDAHLVEQKVASGGPVARLFALRFFTRYPEHRFPKEDVAAAAQHLADPSAEVRLLAAKLVATLVSNPDEAEARLRPLLADRDADVAVAARAGLEKWGVAVSGVRKEVLAKLVAALRDPDAGARAGALRQLAGVGPDAAAAAPEVAKLLAAGQPEAVYAAACEALGAFGAGGAVAAVPALFDAASNRGHPLGAAAYAALKDNGVSGLDPTNPAFAADLKKKTLNTGGWVPDAASAALARIGGDELVRRLIPMTNFTTRNTAKASAKFKTPTGKLGGREQFWAVALLAKIDPATLSPQARDDAAKRLEAVASLDPNAECRRAAREGADRLKQR